MSDPNFPPNLNIQPLVLPPYASQHHGQEAAIARYGIAGRVWEAGQSLLDYFDPEGRFDPPCSMLRKGPHRILELGSGQAWASLHLATLLSPEDLLILTDLPDVIPLCQDSIDRWGQNSSGRCRIFAQALAWGQDSSNIRRLGPFSHILMCDLIYFPHLYPPLLVTLLELTEPASVPTEEEFGPEVVLSYHSRSLNLEESFFDALSLYFKLTPVIGANWEGKIFVCKRWKVTEEWAMPNLSRVMNGSQGVVKGRGFGLVDKLFGSIEW